MPQNWNPVRVCFSCYREGCPNLEMLNISWCQRVTNVGVITIAKSCKQLKHIYCKGCSHVSYNYKLEINVTGKSKLFGTAISI